MNPPLMLFRIRALDRVSDYYVGAVSMTEALGKFQRTRPDFTILSIAEMGQVIL